VVLEAKWHLCPECYKSVLVSVLFSVGQCLKIIRVWLPHTGLEICCIPGVKWCAAAAIIINIEKMRPLAGPFPEQNQSALSSKLNSKPRTQRLR